MRPSRALGWTGTVRPSEDSGQSPGVSVPPELVPLVEKHLTEHAAEPGVLVFTDLEGRPLGRNMFRPIWAAACSASGVSGLHFHDLRGSGATGAAASGATVREVMARLGHTTATVALRYQHATHERDRAIAEKLGAFMRDAAAKGEEPGGNILSITSRTVNP